jgi:hypothetical protein
MIIFYSGLIIMSRMLSVNIIAIKIFIITGWMVCPDLSGQSVVRGRVIDSETGEALPFVNIVYNEKGTGTTTSLDGHFSITTIERPRFLKLSFVGYETIITELQDSEQDGLITLQMNSKPFLIEEVMVSPGINPAHRIIEMAFRNRSFNNPEMLESFSYTSYNKLFFTLVPDTVLSRVTLPGSPNISIRFSFSGTSEGDNQSQAEADVVGNLDEGKIRDENSDYLSTGNGQDMTLPEQDTLLETKADSSEIKMREFLEKQHLFLMETVSKREYKRPGRNNETVVASRVSGFRDPSFTLLATQLQSFTFYDDFISLLDRNYVNPISRGSTSRYSFILEDSMYTEQDDTLFIISFRPYSNRNFDGLRGVVYINSNGYAVQNVIAEPNEPVGIFTIRIQQNYQFVESRQWFPSELNTDIILGNESVSTGSSTRYSLVGIGKAYLSDIMIEPGLPGRRFNNIEMKVLPDAHRQDEDFWSDYRVEPLTGQERETYHVIDSIGDEVNLDRTLGIFEALASGYIPWGFMNIDYSSFIDYNYFEGFRPGLRMVTNDNLSGIISIGGHIGWGTRDRKIKYGGEAGLNLYKPADANIGISWKSDVMEAGSHSFLESDSPFSSEDYRRFMIDRMDFIRQYEASAGFRLLRHFKSRIYLSVSDVSSGDDYLFLDNGVDRNMFRFSETGVQFRFAFRERFMQTPRGNKISLGTDFPVIWMNLGWGSGLLEGDYEYTRAEARIMHSFLTKRFGITSLMIEGGLVNGNVPLHKLYNGSGSFRKFSVEAANSFATMRMLEFVSDEFISLFFRQNFGSLLYRRGSFRPELVFVTNAGFGRLSNPEDHINIPVRSLEKGYFESGLLINNIYRQFFAGYGLGLFYRYGPYSFNKVIDNFAFKFTFNINLR